MNYPVGKIIIADRVLILQYEIFRGHTDENPATKTGRGNGLGRRVGGFSIGSV